MGLELSVGPGLSQEPGLEMGAANKPLSGSQGLRAGHWWAQGHSQPSCKAPKGYKTGFFHIQPRTEKGS